MKMQGAGSCVRRGLFRVLTSLAAMAALLFLAAAGVQGAAGFSGRLESSLSLPTGSSGDWATNELSGRTDFKLALDSAAGNLAGLHAVLRVKESYGSAAAPQESPAVTLDLDEVYVNVYRGDLSFRLGKQRVEWGSAYKINPTSFVNPLDMTNPLEERLALPAALATYVRGEVRISAVWLPEFKPAVTIETIPNPLNPGNSLPVESVTPPANLANAEWALQVTRRNLGGFDASLSYFRGREDLPTVTLVGFPPSSARAEYPSVGRVGLDVVGAVNDAGLWLEGAVSTPESGRQYYEVVVGGDYTLNNGLYLMGQFYQMGADHPAVVLSSAGSAREAQNYLVAVGRKSVGDNLTWQLSAVYAFRGEGYALLPEVTFNLADATDLVVGYAYVKGGEGDPLLSWFPAQAYAKVRMSF